MKIRFYSFRKQFLSGKEGRVCRFKITINEMTFLDLSF